MRKLLKFWTDAGGQMAITFAIAAPLLFACVGFGIDYASWSRQQAKLQGIADATVVAAARELYMANADLSQVNDIAKAFANAQLMNSQDSKPLTVTASVNDGNQGAVAEEPTVQVTVTQPRATYFTAMISNEFQPLSAVAVARVMGGGRVCVIGLDPSDDQTIILASDASLTANNCGVFSNSTNSTGLAAYRNALLTAGLVCSSGGYGGTASNFSPKPLTDCPALPDPLEGRQPPPFGGCDFNNYTVSGATVTLSPGVYCGGLGVYKGSDVTLEPGIYVIKDGPLSVTSTGQFRGENVGFYLTGADSTFLFAASSVVRLSAPKDGPMAGLLFFEDRTVPMYRKYQITSEDAGTLTGTIYLPNGLFLVSSKNPIAKDSPYTAIVARKISLYRSSRIVINSDYSATDIPVPTGLGNTSVGRNIVLSR